MLCKQCGAYFRKTPWNNSDTHCENCNDGTHDMYPTDAEVQEEVDHAVYGYKDGSYRVKPVFYD